MKKIIVSWLLFVLCFFSVSAEEHMKFMGIPLDGPKNEFVSKLVDKGFVFVAEENNQVVLSGSFNGVKDCMLLVIPDKSNAVVATAVMFPPKTTWGELYSDYTTLKERLSKKYKFESKEEHFKDSFLRNLNDSRDMLRYLAIKNHEAVFTSCFSSPQGFIMLSINELAGDCCVAVSYFDIENGRLYVESIDDL